MAKAAWKFVLAPLSLGLPFALLHLSYGQTEPSGLPSPIPSPLWSEASENRSCSNADCPAGRGFIVDSKGAYRTGRGADGNVTAEELARLTDSGNAVAKQNLVGDLICDSSGAEADVNVTLSKTGGRTAVIYEGRPDGTLCHRGSTGSVIALKNELDLLAQKYDREQAGSTAPAPITCASLPDSSSCGRGCVEITPECGNLCAEGYQCVQGKCRHFYASCDPCAFDPTLPQCNPDGPPPEPVP